MNMTIDSKNSMRRVRIDGFKARRT